MTPAVAFQASQYRTCKHFYRKEVGRYWQAEFPQLVSYQRFIACLPSVLAPWAADRRTRLGATHGIALIDSLPLAVCHNRRTPRYKVFAGLAQRAKSSMGWFYSFKRHFIINEQGELLAFRLALEPQIGPLVAKSTVYRLPERQGWRKLAPRPFHPDTSLKAQEAFQKSSGVWCAPKLLAKQNAVGRCG